VRKTARSHAATIASATGSPAGVKLMVPMMDERLAVMQRQIVTAKAQNRLLATRMRQLAMSYRMAGGANPVATMSGMMGGLRYASPSRHARRHAELRRVGPAKWQAEQCVPYRPPVARPC
jgi:hypothetical protein